jgi:hypothetical protein
MRDTFIDTQDGATFAGVLQWTGGGSFSDKHCGQFGRFTGTMSPDGTLTLTAEQVPATAGCTRISGDNVFRGTWNAEKLEGSLTDRASCYPPGAGTTPFEANRTFTFSIRRFVAP